MMREMGTETVGGRVRAVGVGCPSSGYSLTSYADFKFACLYPVKSTASFVRCVEKLRINLN